MRLIIRLFLLASVAFGGWKVWNSYPEVRHLIHDKIDGEEFSTLEIRYTTSQIINTHEKELLKNEEYSLLEPKLIFYPYVMMEVKYAKDQHSSGEGVLLWGLTDGEMVIDANSWERTHGFEDCLLSKADKHDFKILKALVECGGSVDRDKLYQSFRVDTDTLDDWVESCRRKKLLVVSGNKMRLHFESPRLHIQPETKLTEALVTLPGKHSSCIQKRYSPAQVKHLIEIAFGQDFAIRKSREVFLPVYSIAIQNPDGSIRTTYWNALNGKRFEHSPSP